MDINDSEVTMFLNLVDAELARCNKILESVEKIEDLDRELTPVEHDFISTRGLIEATAANLVATKLDLIRRKDDYTVT